ncbi:hypothetical protein CHL78_012075 [Romboutsia weinsteinii]|uniref:Uncharacterized protein n=2 Tax=Romboutsia weinsteinii TaxID=2020949 RepID=A0A371J1W2_9FIRM|nr:hypothetical protein CHL78_012075 [Romboutsia weinsteinii]
MSEVKTQVNIELIGLGYDLSLINSNSELIKDMEDNELIINGLLMASRILHNEGKDTSELDRIRSDFGKRTIPIKNKLYGNDSKCKEEVLRLMVEHGFFGRELGEKEQYKLLQIIRLTYKRDNVNYRNKGKSYLFSWLRFMEIVFFEKAKDGLYYIEIPKNCNFEDLCKKCYKGKCPNRCID